MADPTPNPSLVTKANPTKKDMTFNFGKQGEMLVSSFQNEEQRIDELKLQDYRRMKDNDGQVQMLLNATVNTILSAGYTIEDDTDFQTKDKDTHSQEYDFIERNLLKPKWKGGMSVPIESISRNFLRALEEGFRIFEVIYRVEDGVFKLDRLSPRAAASGRDKDVEVIVDNNGHFVGFHQKTSFKSESIDITLINNSDISKTINVVFGEEYGSNYGRSALKPIWYHYDKAHKAMYLNHIGHELGAVKFRHLKKIGTTSNETDTALENILERVGVMSWISYDKNAYELTFEDVSDAAVMKVGKEMIDYHTNQMAKAWLAQFVDLGTTQSGSRALGESQQDFFKYGLQAVARILIERPWNKVISDLVKMNFDKGIYPTLKVNPINDESATNLYSLFTELVKKGKVNDATMKKITEKTTEKLGIPLTEEELNEEIKEPANPLLNPLEDKRNVDKPVDNTKEIKTDLTEHTHDNIDLEESRPLFPDEQKVRLRDLQRKMDDVKMRSEFILKSKLELQKGQIIDDAIEQYRKGVKSISRLNIQLAQESTYSEELYNIFFELLEYGKISAANELNVSVPNLSASDRKSFEEQIQYIIDEQTAKLEFRFRTLLNNASQNNLPENDVVVLLGQEFNGFWNSMIGSTLDALVGSALNKGRGITFAKNSELIFAYRYTAVLDNRTTDYCRALDGRVLQSNDPQYFMISPPNHFGCRSFWTPITKEEAQLYGIRVDGKPVNIPTYSSISTFRDIPNRGVVEEVIQEASF